MFRQGLLLLSCTLLTVVVAPDPSSGAVTIDDCVTGQYFKDWTKECKTCGICRDEVICEKSSGLCPGGCKMWWYPPDFCWGYVGLLGDGLTLAHITDGPEVKEERPDRVEICFNQDQTLVDLESAPYYAYIIEYAEADGNEYKNDADYIPVQETLLIHKDVIGLDINTEYKFRVVLFRVYEQTVYERVDTSAVSYGKTACMAPARATITSAVPLPSLTAVRVKWHLGSSGCDYYHQIELWYRLSNETDGTRMIVQESMTETVIYNLVGGLSYLITIKAFNNEIVYSQSSRVQLNLIPEAVENDSRNERQNQKDDDDNTNDKNFHISIAVAAAAGILAVIAIIVAISVYCKLKKSHSSTTRQAPPCACSASNPGYEHGNGAPALPAARGPSVASHKYEGLGPRPEGQTYDSLNERAYDNSANPTYDIL